MESEEAGWISLCDLLLLLFALGLLTSLISLSRASFAQRSAQVGEQTIGELQSEMARLRSELGEWTIVAEVTRLERDREHQVFEKLGSSAEEIEASLKTMQNAAEDVRAKLTAALVQAEARAEKEQALRSKAEVRASVLESGLAEVENQKTRVTAELSRCAGFQKELTEELARAQTERASAEGALQAAEGAREAAISERQRLAGVIESAGAVKQELLGIPGSLRNVVFVVDRSSSMTRGGRWDDARRTIGGWIRHLPVERCAMVLFDSSVQMIPKELDDGLEAALDSREIPQVGESLRVAMLKELDGMQPQGSTQTLRGLRRAMQFREVDAIILFTDGAPDPGNGESGDPRERILQLVTDWKRDHPEGRIHTVGIGDYFNSVMRDFLLGVAHRSGGTFIGR